MITILLYAHFWRSSYFVFMCLTLRMISRVVSFLWYERSFLPDVSVSDLRFIDRYGRKQTAPRETCEVAKDIAYVRLLCRPFLIEQPVFRQQVLYLRVPSERGH